MLNILLARWLTPEDYGAFAVAFAVFLFLSGFHNALILDPMAVSGALKPDTWHISYVKKLFLMQLGLSIILGLILSIAGLFFQSPIKDSLIGMGISTPFILSVWFFRNSFYIKSESNKASVISSVYTVSLISGLVWLNDTKLINLPGVFLLISGVSLLTLFTGICFYRENSAVPTSVNFSTIARENWNYGKWLVLTAFSNGLTTLSFAPLIGIALGLREVAAFKGWQNLINPMQQVLAASTLLMVPRFAKQKLNQGNYAKLFSKTSLLILLLTSVYIAVILVFSKPLISLFYKQDFYAQYWWLIIAFSIYLLIIAFGTNIMTFLRAQKRSKSIFISKTIAAVFLTLCFPFILWFKSLEGIMLVLILIAISETLALLVFLVSPEAEHL